MIRKYKNDWGVILPRGGGVKRFETEKAAKQFMLACGLFEDVWPSDEPEDAGYDEYVTVGIEHEEVSEDALEEQTEQPEEDD
jgi:hypothetical protein